MASNNRTGQAGELWPVFLLLVVVAVPTIGVLWFVGVAMENQRMATRQQLTELYRLHLQNVQKQIDTDWQRRLEQADDLADDEGAQEVFATAVTRGIGDSIVLYDEAARVRFPSTFATSRERQVGPEWTEARRLEDESASPLAASVVYARIAEKATTELERISAFQAQLRCLLQAGQPKTAHTLMVHLLQSDAFDSLADPHARSIAANIQLMMIEQLEPTMEVDRLVGRLAEMVNDYGESVLSSPQRLFLMKRLAEIAPSRIDQRLLNAEEMATRFVATQSTPSGDQLLRESQIPGMWQASVASGRMVILIQEANLLANIFQSATRTPLPVGADIYVTAPGDDSRIAALISSSAGAHLPGWRLSLALRDSHQIDTTAKQRNQLYLWTGIVVVLFTSVLGVFIARAFRRQIHMANFKNDLVGTVSHELKTPLSSMRLLVDTVLKQC